MHSVLTHAPRATMPLPGRAASHPPHTGRAIGLMRVHFGHGQSLSSPAARDAGGCTWTMGVIAQNGGQNGVATPSRIPLYIILHPTATSGPTPTCTIHRTSRTRFASCHHRPAHERACIGAADTSAEPKLRRSDQPTRVARRQHDAIQQRAARTLPHGRARFLARLPRPIGNVLRDPIQRPDPAPSLEPCPPHTRGGTLLLDDEELAAAAETANDVALRLHAAPHTQPLPPCGRGREQRSHAECEQSIMNEAGDA